MLLNRFERVLRATRPVPAGGGEDVGKSHLVEADGNDEDVFHRIVPTDSRRSFSTSGLFVFSGGLKGTTKISIPGPISGCRRNASRISRFHRFLSTAPPTLLGTLIPRRDTGRSFGRKKKRSRPRITRFPVLYARSISSLRLNLCSQAYPNFIRIVYRAPVAFSRAFPFLDILVACSRIRGL